MATRPPHRSQAGNAFLSDVFANADPETAEFMARHNALLERVTVLERAIEVACGHLAAADLAHDREQNAYEEDEWREAWGVLLRAA